MRLTLVSLSFAGSTLGGAASAWAGGPDPERPALQRPSQSDGQSQGQASAAPKDQAPDQVEPAIEPASAQTDATDATAETAEPEQAIVAEQPASAPIQPAPDPNALPSYADVVEAPILAPSNGPIIAGREVPPDGRGMLALGSLFAVGGAGLVAGSVGFAVNDRGADIWAPTLVFGVLALGGASGFIVGGHRRHVAYDKWEAEQADDIPRQGSGLVVSGAVLVSAGAAAGMLGTFGWMSSNIGFQLDDSPTPPIFPALVGLGLGSLALGSTLLIVGMSRHKRFGEWRNGGLARVQMLPTVASLPGGGQIGLVGRF